MEQYSLVADVCPYRSAYMKGEEFLDTLAGVSTVPVVVIISDGENGKKSKGALLPPDWLVRVNAKTIAFNPVTSINMVKLLTRIALEESQKGGRKFRVPEKAALENLAESVGGDLRGAINALQFSCLNEVADLREAFHSVNAVASSKAKKKEGKGKASSLSKIGGRDQRLQLFHALGKVLYSKTKLTWIEYIFQGFVQQERRGGGELAAASAAEEARKEAAAGQS